ncbi:porin family protein [Rhizobium redzepovicii]|jgi:outer membrane immunogenic protein|uniref:Porin family protein n=1 Tax=Rhizobium redzepovicii TaxID=2867518 RepID=A0AAW8P4B3_9HYPH|nr:MULTISPECIES: outer membrane protein [Rhizobium]MBY4589878.1 porin family protein [Rhizobium redzepovicii]MBY4614299.1 porin family protein [Rhizobium redzepovicii]MDF0661185.1 porin family protein [Rhizobium sp. BC49]MDR9761840.1 porin family protein [Rhizobium redzepovicii]MDR9784006.1 porin family protein [Rhizobium redzepovicii]
MRVLIAGLMASVFAIAGVSAAQAADAVDQVPEAPVAQEAPVKPAGSWEGFYLGGAGTYNMGDFGSDRHTYGFGGQVFTGYNWQQGQIVYGVESDLGYSGDDVSSGGVKNKYGWNGSVRGRVGYDMNPFLLYGTAGLALGDVKVSDGTSDESKTNYGYTVGAGVEAFVTNNITTRLEYRYTDYQSKDYDLDSGSFSRGYDENSVKLGIGVKF